MPFTIRDNEMTERQKRAHIISRLLFVSGALFALIAGFLPVTLPVYAALVLAALTGGLLFKNIASPPNTNSRNFLYLAASAASITLAAALLFAVGPSVAMVLLLTALIISAGSISSTFLAKKHSIATKLPTLTHFGYALTAAAFVGLGLAFSLMAAGILPSFVLLPVLAAATVATGLLASIITACTASEVLEYKPVGAANPDSGAWWLPPAFSDLGKSAAPAPSISGAATKPVATAHEAADVDTNKNDRNVQVPVLTAP